MGFPVAIGEALAVGVRIVASAVSGISEVLHYRPMELSVLDVAARALATGIAGLAPCRSSRYGLATSRPNLIEDRYDTCENGRWLAEPSLPVLGKQESCAARTSIGTPPRADAIPLAASPSTTTAIRLTLCAIGGEPIALTDVAPAQVLLASESHRGHPVADEGQGGAN